MANSSLTGGYLAADAPLPAYDDALDQIFQGLVVGITGLDINLVRPRFQPVVPTQPPIGTDWCAISVMTITPDAGPWIGYDPQNNVGPVTRHETLEVMASFYGPNSKGFSALFRDGLGINQNTYVLSQNAMAYVGCSAIRNAPTLVNEQFLRRQDITITFRRKVTRSYQIEYFAIAEIQVIADPINETVMVPPTPWDLSDPLVTFDNSSFTFDGDE